MSYLFERRFLVHRQKTMYSKWISEKSPHKIAANRQMQTNRTNQNTHKKRDPFYSENETKNLTLCCIKRRTAINAHERNMHKIKCGARSREQSIAIFIGSFAIFIYANKFYDSHLMAWFFFVVISVYRLWFMNLPQCLQCLWLYHSNVAFVCRMRCLHSLEPYLNVHTS